jgi:hypothetical protein
MHACHPAACSASAGRVVVAGKEDWAPSSNMCFESTSRGNASPVRYGARNQGMTIVGLSPRRRGCAVADNYGRIFASISDHDADRVELPAPFVDEALLRDAAWRVAHQAVRLTSGAGQRLRRTRMIEHRFVNLVRGCASTIGATRPTVPAPITTTPQCSLDRDTGIFMCPLSRACPG